MFVLLRRVKQNVKLSKVFLVPKQLIFFCAVKPVLYANSTLVQNRVLNFLNQVCRIAFYSGKYFCRSLVAVLNVVVCVHRDYSFRKVIYNKIARNFLCSKKVVPKKRHEHNHYAYYVAKNRYVVNPCQLNQLYLVDNKEQEFNKKRNYYRHEPLFSSVVVCLAPRPKKPVKAHGNVEKLKCHKNMVDNSVPVKQPWKNLVRGKFSPCVVKVVPCKC